MKATCDYPTRNQAHKLTCIALGYYAAGSYKEAGNITNPKYYEENVGNKTGEPTLPELQDSAAGN